jgi:hypothetical protein
MIRKRILAVAGILTVPLSVLAFFTSSTSAQASAPAHHQACAGFIQWSFTGVPGYVWATRWHPNIDGCQQRSKVQCSTHGITKDFYGGWVTPTDKWSGVNCPPSYPAFIKGGYQTREFSGAPLVANKWVFSQGRR